MPGSESYFAERGFKVGKSLRFNDNDTARLSRTFTSAGNTKKWTFSCWVKRGEIDGESHTLFATDRSGTNDFDYIRIQTDDSVYAAVYSDDENYHFRIITNNKLRDLNTWYHIVVRYDSTAGTPASPENALYINGELQDDLAAGVTPDQNAVSNFNNAVVHRIGSWNANAAFYLDGCLAEVNFVDGYSLPASYFGETSTVSNQWIPIKYSGAYGNNGFYLTGEGSPSIMSATGGNSTATDGDFKAASFTSNGTFTPSADGYVEYLVIAGGGAGAADGATTAGNGGGGAGGFRTGMLAVTANTGYAITVGAGGVGALSASAVNGGNSVFSSITSTGGGGGGYFTSTPGAAGGSGGGGSAQTAAGGAASPAGQGNAGEQATNGQGGGGGGGAGEAGGTDGVGQGGDGLSNGITGSAVTRAGGGGGSFQGATRVGGAGGGGAGGNSSAGGDGSANTGSGGGAGIDGNESGSGGSGIVIIRYKYQ